MRLREKPEVIIAWINGKTVQYKNGDTWGDFPKVGSVHHIILDDVWDDFRIKPKEIVTTTRIELEGSEPILHITYSGVNQKHNLRLTWSEDRKTLLKAEVI
jgi:hypothetical protein